MEGRLVGRLSRPHKVRVSDGPEYRWFPKHGRFFWRSLVGAVGKKGIALNPYILDERSQAYAVYALSHEYLHWLVYRLSDARTARRLDRIGKGSGHHHNLLFDWMKYCIEHNIRRESMPPPQQTSDPTKRVLRNVATGKEV